MYLYFDGDYVVGYGSDYEDGSVEVNSVPEEVDRYLGAYKYDRKTGKYTPDEDRKSYLEGLWAAEISLNEVENWFRWYDQQCMQYQREQRIGKKGGIDIEALDTQAVKNAEEVKRLRAVLASPYVPKEKEVVK